MSAKKYVVKSAKGTNVKLKEQQVKRVLGIVNIGLIILSFLLVLNLCGVSLPNLGFALYNTFDTEDTICIANWQDDYSEINLDLCCHESRKQLECVSKEFEIELFSETTDADEIVSKILSTDVICKTGDGNNMNYYLNNNAYRYCKNQNYWGTD